MATVHQIINYGGTALYDFLTGALDVHEDNWGIEQDPDSGTYTETYMLYARDSDANIISAVNTLSEIAERVRMFWSDPHSYDSIYLKVDATSEQAKRALITDMSTPVPAPMSVLTPLLGRNGAVYTLSITRRAWEKTTTVDVTPGEQLVAGAKYSLPAIAGSLPGVSVDFEIDTASTLTTADPISDVWVGILPNDPTRAANANFVSNWDATLGTNGYDCSNVTVPGKGTFKRIDFATHAEMASRFYVKISDITTADKYIDQLGEFLVLGVVMCTAGTTANMRMDYGFSETNSERCETIYGLTNSDRKVVSLGVINIPQFATRNQNTSFLTSGLGYFRLTFYAERVAGAGSFYIQQLFLIPNKHRFTVHNAALTYTGVGNSDVGHLYTTEDGQNIFLSEHTTVIGDIYFYNMTVNAEVVDFVYPIQGGVMVMAAQGATSFDGRKLVYNWTYRNRYRTHAE